MDEILSSNSVLKMIGMVTTKLILLITLIPAVFPITSYYLARTEYGPGGRYRHTVTRLGPEKRPAALSFNHPNRRYNVPRRLDHVGKYDTVPGADVLRRQPNHLSRYDEPRLTQEIQRGPPHRRSYPGSGRYDHREDDYPEEVRDYDRYPNRRPGNQRPIEDLTYDRRLGNQRPIEDLAYDRSPRRRFDPILEDEGIRRFPIEYEPNDNEPYTKERLGYIEDGNLRVEPNINEPYPKERLGYIEDRNLRDDPPAYQRRTPSDIDARARARRVRPDPYDDRNLDPYDEVRNREFGRPPTYNNNRNRGRGYDDDMHYGRDQLANVASRNEPAYQIKPKVRVNEKSKAKDKKDEE